MLWISTLVAIAAIATGTDTSPDVSGTDSADTATSSALLERIVVVGASASEGFGLAGELEVDATLSMFLDAAWVTPRTPSKNIASSSFFMNPMKGGASQRDAAKEAKVSLLVAIDFLFWFGYGSGISESDRLERLEHGLAMLDEIGGPMLVGDFPDMRPALEGKGIFGGPVIAASQIPEPATIARLNARLDEWSKERPNVIRVPLAEFVTRLQTKQAVELRGLRWTEADCERLLQTDLLHPTVEGTAALALLCLDALERASDDVEADQVRWNVEQVIEGVRKATAAERAASETKRLEREERLRKLEERKQKREREREDEKSEQDSCAGRDAA